MDPSEYAAHFERIRCWKESQARAIQERAEPDQRAEDGFLSRLARKVRQSLHIRIRNFRIRYADRRSSEEGVSPSHPHPHAAPSSPLTPPALRSTRGSRPAHTSPVNSRPDGELVARQPAHEFHLGQRQRQRRIVKQPAHN